MILVRLTWQEMRGERLIWLLVGPIEWFLRVLVKRCYCFLLHAMLLLWCCSFLPFLLSFPSSSPSFFPSFFFPFFLSLSVACVVCFLVRACACRFIPECSYYHWKYRKYRETVTWFYTVGPHAHGASCGSNRTHQSLLFTAEERTTSTVVQKFQKTDHSSFAKLTEELKYFNIFVIQYSRSSSSFRCEE